MLDGIDFSSLFALEPKASNISAHLSAPSASALEFVEQIHRRNSETLKAIIRERGWPSAQSVGENAEAAAFMIVQHADYDPAFQRECHQLMLENILRGGDTKLGFLAFLTDRILCNAGKHQRFGTQIREALNGCFVPKPMEDPEHIDEIREQVGLHETLADYLHRVNTGDLLLYRPLLNGYGEQLERVREDKIIPFPKKPVH